jgi:hypothetical protein
VTVAAVALASTLSHGSRLPSAPKCPIFPRSSHWNKRVDSLPVHPRSAAIVRSIGRDENLHPDFGSGLYEGAPIGIPYSVVGRRARRVRFNFLYSDESDHGRYPLPRRVKIEGGPGSDGDRHVIVVNRRRCRLYELYRFFRPARRGGRHRADSGAVWNLRSNRLRPRGHTSADAAGLPIFAGLARHYEVKRGRIDHALRVTVPDSRSAYVYPARHFASDDPNPDLPRMGERLRLRRDFDISRFPRQARIIMRALKRYGMIVADNGSPWFISGAPSRGWDNDQLNTLKDVGGANFEVVDTSFLPKPR